MTQEKLQQMTTDELFHLLSVKLNSVNEITYALSEKDTKYSSNYENILNLLSPIIDKVLEISKAKKGE